MKVTITSLELRGPLKFFLLSQQAIKVIKQMKATNCKEFKKSGFWSKHYTMTLWNNEAELKDFARSGAHLDAMKKSKEIAKEIRTYTYDAVKLPTWKEAKNLLENAKILRF